MHPTMMLMELSLLSAESPPMNANMDVAAIRKFKGTKNTPAQHSAARSLSVWCSQGGQGGQGAQTNTDTENGRMLTEVVEREVASSKLVLHEGALADLGQHRRGSYGRVVTRLARGQGLVSSLSLGTSHGLGSNLGRHQLGLLS